MKAGSKLIGVHVAAWMVYLLMLFLGANKPDQAFWTTTFSTLIPIIILFYLNIFFLFPKFLQTRKYILLIFLLATSNFITICLRLLLVMIFQRKGIEGFFDNIFSPIVFWNQFRVNLLFIGISFAYWYAVKNYKAEKDQQQLQREVLNARLRSLQYQINPHFLYNTLSLIYTRSLTHSAELANAISRLSDMMRYSLAESETDGRTSLENEITHVKSFIELQQMRFDNKLAIDLHTAGATNGCRVMPLLLITFVENAFKHGQLNNAEYPLKIRLYVADHILSFEIQNKKAPGKKERTQGIGLQNIRNRLELSFPGKHRLDITDTDDEFIVNLKLEAK